ncbi:unnamed protein product [Arabidopsis halleri]
MVRTRRRDYDDSEKMRVPCNFCESCKYSGSSYGCGSEEDQDNEAELLKEVLSLRNQIMRITGRDDDASFAELQALVSRLQDVKVIVKEKIKLIEDERLHQQKKEAEDENDVRTRRRVSVPCQVSTTSSKEKRQEKKQDEGALLLYMESRFETRKSESLQTKFDRLWLFNERMNGREMESITSYDELISFDNQISFALVCLRDQMSTPGREQFARQGKDV